MGNWHFRIRAQMQEIGYFVWQIHPIGIKWDIVPLAHLRGKSEKGVEGLEKQVRLKKRNSAGNIHICHGSSTGLRSQYG